MGEAQNEMTGEGRTRAQRGYRVAFVASAMLILGIVVTLPFSVASVVEDLLGPATGKVTTLLGIPPGAIAAEHSRLHLAVIAVDEVQLLATLRVSGHHVCPAACVQRGRVLFVALDGSSRGDAEGLPPSATILIPETTAAVSEVIQLPVSGVPIRYPFDHYDLVLAVALQRVHPDGRVETLGPGDAPGHLLLSIQELLPQKRMSPPLAVDPRSIRTPSGPAEYAAAYAVTFQRPRYLRLLAVLLVLLIAAAAAYSVLLRPLEDLIVNSGAIVLGVWGIRSILVPVSLHYQTAIDLSLSMVILFLLGGVAVKVLVLAHDRGGLRLLKPIRRTSRRDVDQ